MSLVAALPAAASIPLSAQQVRRPAVLNGRRYLQYDVFTDKPLAGNQLAVFTETAGLTADQMQAMTRETKFSECTFVQPAEGAGTDVRLRIFGPANEMQFAGHPVIGSTFALADDGVIAGGRKEFTFGLGIGPTLVELEWQGRSALQVRLDDATEAGIRPDAERAGGAGGDARHRRIGPSPRVPSAGSQLRLAILHGASRVSRRRRSSGRRSRARRGDVRGGEDHAARASSSSRPSPGLTAPPLTAA
jgi:trans-2,3-dihydro-3-hydroxyanthranilate isomerase